MADEHYEQIDVVVDAGASTNEMEALEAVFRGAGVSAKVRDDYLRLSAETLPWALFVTVPLTWLSLKFAGGFVEQAGADSWDTYRQGGWRGLARFVAQVSKARDDRDGTATIRDPTGPDVHLVGSIPEHAYRELGRLDWGAMDDGWLYWNAATGEWWFLQAKHGPRGVPAPDRELDGA